MEKPLTLHQTAKLLGVHYQTVFRKRHLIGFRIPGGRRWYVLPSTLDLIRKKGNNFSRLEVQVGIEKEQLCQSLRKKDHPIIGLISRSQAAIELEGLLEQKIKG